jgi:hypothetical protein
MKMIYCHENSPHGNICGIELFVEKVTPTRRAIPARRRRTTSLAMYKCALTVILHAVYIMLMTKKVAEIGGRVLANRNIKRAKLHVRGRRFGRNTSRQNGIE